jgi:branched-chain amino acid transport system substrate-binding protein
MSKLWRGVGVLALMLGFGAFTSISTQAVAGAATTGAPITVGVVCTCSGPFGADIKAAEQTYQAWVNTVNKAGGLAGHKVVLTLEDDAGNPGTSVSDAQTLISDHVDAILDFSILDQAWAAAVQKSKIPVVGGDETETPYYTSPDFYPEGQTNDSVTVANVLTAKLAKATNLGDLYCAEAPSCAEGVPLIQAAGSKLGVPVVYNAEIAATAPNYTAQCLAAQQAKVSAIFVGDASVIISRVAANCAQQNYSPIWITEGEGFGLMMAATPGLGTKLWSDYGTAPFFDHIPAIAAMDKAVDKYYPGLRSNQNAWTQIAAEAWASGLLLRDAVAASHLTPSGTASPAVITKGLEALKGDTLNGMAPPLTFKAGKDHLIDCWFTGRVVNGTPTMVNGGRLTCAKG